MFVSILHCFANSIYFWTRIFPITNFMACQKSESMKWYTVVVSRFRFNHIKCLLLINMNWTKYTSHMSFNSPSQCSLALYPLEAPMHDIPPSIISSLFIFSSIWNVIKFMNVFVAIFSLFDEIIIIIWNYNIFSYDYLKSKLFYSNSWPAIFDILRNKGWKQ